MKHHRQLYNIQLIESMSYKKYQDEHKQEGYINAETPKRNEKAEYKLQVKKYAQQCIRVLQEYCNSGWAEVGTSRITAGTGQNCG